MYLDIYGNRFSKAPPFTEKKRLFCALFMESATHADF